MNDISVSIQLPREVTDLTGWQPRRGLRIDCPESYEAAAIDLQAVKRRLTDLEEQRKGVTRPLDEAKRKVMEMCRPLREALEENERILKAAMLAYSQAEERKRRELEAELREEARLNRERLEAEARAAAAKGAEDEAEVKREQAENIPIPILAPSTPKPKGISVSESWRAQLTDKMALIRAVAEGKAPAELIEIDMKVANRLALSLKQAFAYPGLKAVKVQSLAAKRG